MFRATKKKKPNRVIVSRTNDDDDDYEEEAVIIQPKMKKKMNKKRPISTIRSFAAEDDDNDNNNDGEGNVVSSAVFSSKSKKKKRKGLGFGGAVAAASAAPDGANVKRSTEELPKDEKDDPESRSYDLDALNALKSQQRYRKKEEVPDLPAPAESAESKKQVTTKKEEEQSYISLNSGSSEPASILTGEDAAAYLGEKHDESNDKPAQGTTIAMDDEASDNDWEVLVTKRAGLATKKGKKTSADSKATECDTKSLEELKKSLSESLIQLEERKEDLTNAHARRQTEVNQVEAEVQKYQSELHQSGEAVEYYQELRLQLTQWVGALRDLKKRLHPLHEALGQVSRESSELSKWTDWENDVVLTLSKANHLVQVMGRQPPPPPPDESMVDEFGRDIKSQHVLARERRFQRRAEIRKQQQQVDAITGSQVVPLTSPDEEEEMNERRDALQQALRIALDDMDEEYASLSNLAALFQEWHRKQPQDYASCHAGMSLADLGSVLIHVDIFSTHYPLNWTASGSFPCMDVLQKMAFNEGLEETPLYRMVDKILVPVFEDVLEHYDMHSLHQTKSMTMYFRDMSKLLPEGNILLDKLTSQVVDRVRRGLQDMAIPIINKEISISNESDTVLVEAIAYANKTQVSRVQAILSNIFIYWVPLLGDSLADPMLDFLSSQFLYLVSSLEFPSKVFRAVWPTLKETQWLNRPELMVSAAPLRAAAAAFEVE